MRLLVTGARGAIGRHVAATARARDFSVVGIGHGSGSSHGTDMNHWLESDVNLDGLTRLTRLAGAPDAVVHLAGGSLVGASVSDPVRDYQRTVESTTALLAWHRTAAPAAPIVFVSSAAVYGSSHQGLIGEGTRLAPSSPYGEHKLEAEMALRVYARSSPASQICILRPFSVYGPGLRKQLIWDLVRRALAESSPIWLGGTGRELRDFVHIADAAECVLNAIPLAQNDCPTFNVCTGIPTATGDIVRMITMMLGDAEVRFSGERRAGDPDTLVGDPALASAVGLSPRTLLREGLEETVAWIREQSVTQGQPR